MPLTNIDPMHSSVEEVEPVTATVVDIAVSGEVTLRVGAQSDSVRADLAARCTEPGFLSPGDRVVALRCDSGASYVVLDRISARVAEPSANEVEKQFVTIDADKGLTLSCGNASITLKRDGKIIVRGTEIVSRASRKNRIRGATVSIN